MTEEEKKAVEAENKNLKALTEEELEGVAGGSGWLEEMDMPDVGIGGGNEAHAPEIIYQGSGINPEVNIYMQSNYNPRTVKTK